MNRRSNRLPNWTRPVKTAADYERARILLAEIDGKITPQEADELRRKTFESNQNR